MKVDARDNGKGRAAAWFRHGVALARDGRTKDAARSFGMAHHADHRLENAALLTFACLKAKEGADSDLVEQLIQTWYETGSMPITRTRADRSLMASLDDRDDTTSRLTALGRLAWTVLGPAARDRLRVQWQSAAASGVECLVERGESGQS
jgi:hypothetical protein